MPSPIAISHIINNIDNSVLIIGPEIMFDDEGKSLISGFTERYIDENIGLIKPYSLHDNLIRTTKTSLLLTIREDFADFFENDFPKKVKSLYQRISQIPFPLVLSLNPDTALESCLKDLNIDPHFDFYFRGTMNKKEFYDVPTKDNPYLYNLFGCYSQPESLILTYDWIIS